MGISLPWPLVQGQYQTDSFEDRVQQNFDALASRLSASATATDWTDLTLENGWTVYSGYTPQFKLDASGAVRFQGEISSGTITGNTSILTVPDGYRPVFRVIFPVTGSHNDASVWIDSSGVLRVNGIGSAIGGMNLAPISYLTA